jgi:lipid A 4'-phosphatase
MLSSVVYLIITAAVGPGIIVNYVLKENFGRARPSQIIEFGGQKTFTPAFIVSDQCLTNCSFSSGHASMAIYFTAIAYAFALRSKNHKTNVASSSRFTIIYLLGCLFGIMVGMSRILMGGHFLSDVAFSCFITLLVNYLLFLWWKKLKLKS